MENFLESSTIHGLIYISTTRKYVRLFWILAVLAGFIVASLMIYQSFQSWNESPIKTAIETQPIAEIHYPKVTVCPPKKTYTDLNYDIMMIRNMTLDNATRDELTNYAVMLLYEHLYNTSMTNLNKLEDNDRYYNWYHGYSKIRLPFHSSGASFFSSSPTLYYYVNTYAKSGTISTQNYGKKFDADNVDTDIQFDVNVYPPEDLTQNNQDINYDDNNECNQKNDNNGNNGKNRNNGNCGQSGNNRNNENQNTILHFNIHKTSMRDILSDVDTISIDDLGTISSEIQNIVYNYTFPRSGFAYYTLSLKRRIEPEDITKQKLELMPGFTLTWFYSGLDIEPETPYSDYPTTKAFVRHGSISMYN